MTAALDLPGGLLVVDKPSGPTSHDVVVRIRRLSGLKTGHGGTLDPLASGVLPLLLGPATRLLRFLPADPKRYRATVRLGYETSTGDAAGTLLFPQRPVDVTTGAIEAALAALTGTISQLPPMYSAKKVGGLRLHRAARRGLDIARPPVAVRIDAIVLVGRDGPDLELDVTCSPGTYVRALATDLGRALGTGATVIALRRTASGPFRLADAVALDDLADTAGIETRLVPTARIPLALGSLEVAPAEAVALAHGRPGACSADAPPGALLALRDASGHLLGVGEVLADAGRPPVVQPRVWLASAGSAASSPAPAIPRRRS